MIKTANAIRKLFTDAALLKLPDLYRQLFIKFKGFSWDFRFKKWMKTGFSISYKFTFVMVTCVALGCGGVGLMAWDTLHTDLLDVTKKSQNELANVVGLQVSDELKLLTERMSDLERLWVDSPGSEAQRKIGNELGSQDALVSFGVYKPVKDHYEEALFVTDGDGFSEVNTSGLPASQFDSRIQSMVQRYLVPGSEGVLIISSAAVAKSAVFTLAFFDEHQRIVRADVKQKDVSRFFMTRPGLTFYVADGKGSVIAHSDPKISLQGPNLANLAFYPELKSGHSGSLYDQNEGAIYGYQSLPSGAGLVSEQDDSVILERANKIVYRCTLVGAMAISFGILITLVFSASFVENLKSLFSVLEKVGEGQFEITTDVRSDDEIGGVARGTRRMITRLQDRERLKLSLAKFNVEDADKILSGDLKLNVERKRMSVLVCELAGGTEDSKNYDEQQRHIAALWVEITKIMMKYLGFIDRTDGTSMRVVWGALSQVNDEGASALSAALEVRKYVRTQNEKRDAKDLSPFKVVVGIHTGDTISGLFGAPERAEFTFIGEGPMVATNLCGATRSQQCDILVSEETYAVIKNKGFAFGPAIELEDLTKLSAHQVVGRKSSDGTINSELSKSEQDAIMEEPQDEKPFAIAPRAEPGPAPVTLSMFSQGMAPAHPTTSIPIGTFTNLGGTGTMSVVVPITQNVPQQTSPFIFQQVDTQNAPVPAPSETAVRTMTQLRSEEPQYYLIRNVQTGITEGPFTVKDLQIISEQPGFSAREAYAYRYGDTMMLPLLQVPGVSRRQPHTQLPPSAPLPPSEIQSNASPEEWFVQREDGRIYGPYTLEVLAEYISNGTLTRTTYCWRQGLPTWLYAYQVPGVDRRQAGPPAPPIPVPKGA